MRETANEPGKYIAFRPPGSVARKIHPLAAGRGVTPTDCILEYMGDWIDLDFADLAAQLWEEVD